MINFLYPLNWQSLKKCVVSSVGKDMEKRELVRSADRGISWYGHPGGRSDTTQRNEAGR